MSSPQWKTAKEFEDITYKKADGVARIAFNRPDVRNAFRPKTTSELLHAFQDAHEDTSIGVVRNYHLNEVLKLKAKLSAISELAEEEEKAAQTTAATRAVVASL